MVKNAEFPTIQTSKSCFWAPTSGALQKASSGSAMASKPGKVATATGEATGSGLAAGKQTAKAKPEVDCSWWTESKSGCFWRFGVTRLLFRGFKPCSLWGNLNLFLTKLHLFFKTSSLFCVMLPVTSLVFAFFCSLDAKLLLYPLEALPPSGLWGMSTLHCSSDLYNSWTFSNVFSKD